MGSEPCPAAIGHRACLMCCRRLADTAGHGVRYNGLPRTRNAVKQTLSLFP